MRSKISKGDQTIDKVMNKIDKLMKKHNLIGHVVLMNEEIANNWVKLDSTFTMFKECLTGSLGDYSISELIEIDQSTIDKRTTSVSALIALYGILMEDAQLLSSIYGKLVEDGIIPPPINSTTPKNDTIH